MTKQPTKAERERWGQVRDLGCIVRKHGGCSGRVTLHHCGTGMGRKKDHSKVIPLCWMHHLGAEGVDGKKISKREWQRKYGTEKELLEKVRSRINGA